jgi:hypothetical protein
MLREALGNLESAARDMQLERARAALIAKAKAARQAAK